MSTTDYTPLTTQPLYGYTIYPSNTYIPYPTYTTDHTHTINTNPYPWIPSPEEVTGLDLAGLQERMAAMEGQIEAILDLLDSLTHKECEEVRGHTEEGCQSPVAEGAGGIPQAKGNWRWPPR